MRWSIHANGDARSVAAQVAESMSKQKCAEPEESIKAAALVVIQRVIEATPEGRQITVSAYGSQSRVDSDPPGKASNSISLTVQYA